MIDDRNLFRPESLPLELDSPSSLLGSGGGPFGVMGWKRVAILDVRGTLAPFAVEVDAEKELVSFDTLSIGMLWDGQVVEMSATDLGSGKTLRHDVRHIRGNTLEVWATDDEVAAVRGPRTLSQADRDEAKRADSEAADAGPVDRFFDRVFGLYGSVAKTAVIVGGAVFLGYLVLRKRGLA